MPTEEAWPLLLPTENIDWGMAGARGQKPRWVDHEWSCQTIPFPCAVTSRDGYVMFSQMRYVSDLG